MQADRLRGLKAPRAGQNIAQPIGEPGGTPFIDLGLERVIVQGFAAVQDADYLESLIDDCGAVGLLVPPP